MPANPTFQILTVRGNQCRDAPEPNHDEYYENALVLQIGTGSGTEND